MACMPSSSSSEAWKAIDVDEKKLLNERMEDKGTNRGLEEVGGELNES